MIKWRIQSLTLERDKCIMCHNCELMKINLVIPKSFQIYFTVNDE